MTRTKLDDDAIRDILTSTASHRAMAVRYGCHPSAIGYIRQGKIHADRLPDLPRWSSATCEQCQHWDGRCDLGHKDPEEEGVQFARWCVSFREAA